MKHIAKFVFVLSIGCGETINASNYAHDCDADIQCTVIPVGDVCSCACNLAAINDRDYDKYVDDLERIGTCAKSCDPTGDNETLICGAGTGARCNAGACATYALPADAAAE